MKKILTLVLAIVCMISAMIPTAYADEVNGFETNSYTEYYEDGSYTVTTVTAVKQNATARSSSYVVVGRKFVDLYNSDDELQWQYKLIGEFQVVEGVSVVCISSTYESDIYDDNWSLKEHSNSYEDNFAYGTAVYKKKVLFITTNTYNVNAELGCDRYGNVG